MVLLLLLLCRGTTYKALFFLLPNFVLFRFFFFLSGHEFRAFNRPKEVNVFTSVATIRGGGGGEGEGEGAAVRDEFFASARPRQ